MLFNSYEFFVFLAIVLSIYHSVSHRWQNRFLVVASYVFYGWWDWRFLSLLAVSTVVDYWCARLIDGSENRRARNAFLALSLATNLGILGFFKYFKFFVGSSAELLSLVGLNPSIPVLNIVLPVGISFYTFQTMSYTIDVWRRHSAPTRDFVAFALYVSFFPQLVAGPIERSTALLPQIVHERAIDRAAIRTGCQLIFLGLFKKVFIADGVAPYVEKAFDAPESFASTHLVLAVYLFAIQIYGDFAGYTDIARGVARLLGVNLSVNFRQPYWSQTVTEFWRRWHISLSTWLRDYLYIPLGGNRAGLLNTYRNLMVTMLLGGLWHGASWTFLVWGGLHGLFLLGHRRFDRREPERPSSDNRWRALARDTAKTLATFNLVCFAWVFFRAESFDQALSYLARIAVGEGSVTPEFAMIGTFYLLVTALVDFPCWLYDEEHPFRPQWRFWVRGCVYAAMIVGMTLVGDSNVRPFIYFQF